MTSPFDNSIKEIIEDSITTMFLNFEDFAPLAGILAEIKIKLYTKIYINEHILHSYCNYTKH